MLGLCLLPLPVIAEESKVIRCDLESCIGVAFSNHPILKTGEARQSAAQVLLKVNEAERMPSLDLEGSTGYFSGESITPFDVVGGITEKGIRQRHSSGGYYQATINAQIPIFKEGTLLGQASGLVRQARFGLSKEEWENQALRVQVALKVAEAYVQVLKNRKAVKAQEEIVVSLEGDYNLAQAKFNQNLISENDLLMAEVRLATGRRDISLSQLALRRSQQALSAAMGLDRTHEIDIQDLREFPAPLRPLEELVALARENNSQVRAQQFKVRESEEEVKGVESERYPALSVAAHYGVADDFDRPLNDQWVAALQMKVPLFDFGLIRKKAAVARARVVEEEKRLLDFKLDMEQQVHEFYFHVQELEEEIELIKKQIQQTQEALKLNQAMFQQNLLPQSVVHDTEAALLKLQLAQSDAEYDQNLNRFELRLLSGEWNTQGQQ